MDKIKRAIKRGAFILRWGGHWGVKNTIPVHWDRGKVQRWVNIIAAADQRRGKCCADMASAWHPTQADVFPRRSKLPRCMGEIEGRRPCGINRCPWVADY